MTRHICKTLGLLPGIVLALTLYACGSGNVGSPGGGDESDVNAVFSAQLSTDDLRVDLCTDKPSDINAEITVSTINPDLPANQYWITSTTADFTTINPANASGITDRVFIDTRELVVGSNTFNMLLLEEEEKERLLNDWLCGANAFPDEYSVVYTFRGFDKWGTPFAVSATEALDLEILEPCDPVPSSTAITADECTEDIFISIYDGALPFFVQGITPSGAAAWDVASGNTATCGRLIAIDTCAVDEDTDANVIIGSGGGVATVTVTITNTTTGACSPNPSACP